MSCLTGKLACFSSKKMCVGMGMCVQASFDSLECLSHIFSLAAVLWHQETCVCPDWPSSFWLLGPKLGLVSFCFYWAGWWATLHYGSVQVVVVAVRMGWWCHGQRLPVSSHLPKDTSRRPIFSYLQSQQREGITDPFNTCVAYLGVSIWHLNVGQIWENKVFPKFLLRF